MPEPSVRKRCPLCGASLAGADTFPGEDRLHGTSGRFEVAICPRCGAGVTRPPASVEQLASYYPGVRRVLALTRACRP